MSQRSKEPDPADLYGSPWQPAAAREALRRARHKLWLSRLTERDWSRIEALADIVERGESPARLDGLDAPGIAVGACIVGDEKRFNGERIGTLREGRVAVLVWDLERRPV